MFPAQYATHHEVNEPVHDAVYYRLKSVLKRVIREGLMEPDWESNLYFCGVVNKYQTTHAYVASPLQ